MHVNKLRGVVQVLLQKESENRLNKLLSIFDSQLNNLAGNPQNTTHQIDVANALGQVEAAYEKMKSEFEPADVVAIEEIGGKAFFLEDFPATFRELLSRQQLTPAAAREPIQRLLADRKRYIEDLTQLNERLDRIEVSPLDLKDDLAELGFLLPRSLFNDNLEDLVKELRKINTVFRTFSELEMGKVEPARVKTISTSDPLFTFGISPEVIISIGIVVSWLLSKWKEVEEIRQIRAQTSKIGSFSDKEVDTFFGDKIKRHIDEAIEEKVTELSSKIKDNPRKNELQKQIKFSIEYLAAGIERGMQVEIVHLPVPTEESSESGEGSSKSTDELAKAAAIAKELSFPKRIEGRPILALPSEPNASPPKQ